MAGGSVGIAVGCVLGMLPLLFIDGKKGDREESPRYGEYVFICIDRGKVHETD